MSGSRKYIVPEDLAKILKPLPEELVRLVTLKQLQRRGYWQRPVIGPGQTGLCPCCGEDQAEAAFGICGGCYGPAMRGAMFGPALLDHLAMRADVEEIEQGEGMTKEDVSGKKPYDMPSALAALLRPVPCKEAEAITVSGLKKYWIRPLIKSGEKSGCPCCSGVHPLKAGGICSGCYSDKVMTNKLTGKALLEHLAVRAAGGIGRGKRPEKKEIKQSTIPASEPSSPAATPPAGAGKVESGPSPESTAFENVFRIALGLEKDSPVQEFSRHLEDLMRERDRFRIELEDLTEIIRSAAVDGEDLPKRADQLVKTRDQLREHTNMLIDAQAEIARILGAGEYDSLVQVAARFMNELELEKAKNEALTQEIAELNRLLAAEPMAPSEEAIVAKWSALPVPDGYEALTAVLHDAIDQAAHGKGLDRHADDRPFHDQPIMRETKAVGPGFPAGQARKKILEAVRCCGEHPERAVADLLGAINYTAALVIAIRSMMVEQAA